MLRYKTIIIVLISSIMFFNCDKENDIDSIILEEGTLMIEITNIRNNSGNIAFELSDSLGVSIMSIKGTISKKTSLIKINDLENGKYSFRYFHDENKDNNLNVNGIIPTEGYGFSNNASATFGEPSLESTIFAFENSLKMDCRISYIL